MANNCQGKGPAPLRPVLIRSTRDSRFEFHPPMDLDDFDYGSTYSLSSADEPSSSDEEQENLELPGAELRIEGDFKYATSFVPLSS